jgi:hypothetical protein
MKKIAKRSIMHPESSEKSNVKNTDLGQNSNPTTHHPIAAPR